MRWGFRGFNAAFGLTNWLYTRIVGGLLRVTVLVLIVYAGLLLLTNSVFRTTPKGFIPTQDMGYLLVNVQLPDAASAERTRHVTDRVQHICLTTPGIKHTLSVAGQSFATSTYASNFGSMFVILDDFSNRQSPELGAEGIAQALRMRFMKEVPEAMTSVFPAPPVRGVGRTGGFKFMVEDRGDAGLQVLQAQADTLAAKAGDPGPDKRPRLTMQPNVFRANSPQLYVDLNRSQCMTMGVALADAFNTLQVYLGVALRERLQPLWPHLASGRPSRRPFPQSDRKSPATHGPQSPGVDGAHGFAGRSARNRRPLDPDPLQHVSRFGDPRRLDARSQFPAGDRYDATAGRAIPFARHAL